MKKNLFKFYTKSDWTVIIILLVVAIIAVALFKIVGGSMTQSTSLSPLALSPTGEEGNGQIANSQRPIANNSQLASNYYVEPKRQKETFYFDPNTADSTQLLRLGLAPYQVRNIYKYRAAGGVYSHKEDFAKLYGLTKGDYDRLAPYIRIADKFKPAAEFIKGTSPQPSPEGKGVCKSLHLGGDLEEASSHHYKLSPGETIPINAADTTIYQKVPGIGSYYSRQIVRYGKQLGGYCNREQLLEIDGFPEETLQYFSIEENNDGISKIKINRLSLSELRKHPYINFYQAREITDYRRKNGPLRSISDMQFFTTFTEKELQRLAPYLEF